MDHRFQINLRGLIDLLSNHLYSGPEVFVRELLQNGVDAIRAAAAPRAGPPRRDHRRGPRPARQATPATLVFTRQRRRPDRGGNPPLPGHHRRKLQGRRTLGTAHRLHRPVRHRPAVLLRRQRRDRRRHALGAGRTPTLEWRGRPDGTYTIKTLDRDLAPGTQVYLTCKKGCEDSLRAGRVRELAQPLWRPAAVPDPRRRRPRHAEVINAGGRPGAETCRSRTSARKALLDYGRQALRHRLLRRHAAAFRRRRRRRRGLRAALHAEPGDEAHAPRLPQEHAAVREGGQPAAGLGLLRQGRRQRQRPAADRLARIVLRGRQPRRGPRRAGRLPARLPRRSVRRDDPSGWNSCIALHHLAIKALAVQDDEFYSPVHRLAAVRDFAGRDDARRVLARTIRRAPLAPNDDQFRQIARVASAQGLCVINGGYVPTTPNCWPGTARSSRTAQRKWSTPG